MAWAGQWPTLPLPRTGLRKQDCIRRCACTLIAGETRACTNLMRATNGKVALKTGAEGFFIAILPDQKIGVALKAACGTKRAAECAITSILVKLGALDANHPEAVKYRNAPIENRRGIITGMLKPAAAFA